MKQRVAFAARVTMQWRAVAQRLSSLLLVLIALTLIVLGRIDAGLVNGARARLSDAMMPVLALIQSPIGTVRDTIADTRGLFDLAAANARLREENSRLKQWEGTAYRLEAQNQVLRGLVNLRPAGAADSADRTDYRRAGRHLCPLRAGGRRRA